MKTRNRTDLHLKWYFHVIWRTSGLSHAHFRIHPNTDTNNFEIVTDTDTNNGSAAHP